MQKQIESLVCETTALLDNQKQIERLTVQLEENWRLRARWMMRFGFFWGAVVSVLVTFAVRAGL